MPAISGRGKLGQCKMMPDLALLFGQGQREEVSSGLGKRSVIKQNVCTSRG